MSMDVTINTNGSGKVDPEDVARLLKRRDPVTRETVLPASVTVDGVTWTPADGWTKEPGISLDLSGAGTQP